MDKYCARCGDYHYNLPCVRCRHHHQIRIFWPDYPLDHNTHKVDYNAYFWHVLLPFLIREKELGLRLSCSDIHYPHIQAGDMFFDLNMKRKYQDVENCKINFGCYLNQLYRAGVRLDQIPYELIDPNA